jgi:bisphosphoglycerate-independent phosphoglycerate mutase
MHHASRRVPPIPHANTQQTHKRFSNTTGAAHILLFVFMSTLYYFCTVKTYDRLGLIILDGWGLNSDPQVSAIEAAHTPYMDYLWAHYPTSTLVTYGEDVGLPDGQMGNSEVGHINIGAGRIVYQELARINKSIRERELHTMPALLKALADTNKRGSALHLMGLVSDGGVHSHINHLKALVDIALSQNVQRIFIHVFTDGRDVDPKSGAQFIADLQQYIQGTRVVIASIVGRYFAMDRDKRWERVQKGYNLLVNGIGTPLYRPRPSTTKFIRTRHHRRIYRTSYLHRRTRHHPAQRYRHKF